MDRAYLDYNATAPLRPEARAAMIAALDTFGNASSVHAEGRAARAPIEQARVAVAGLVGGDPKCVTFTAGGARANNTVLPPDLRLGRPNLDLEWLLVGATEHPSVLSGGRFPPERVKQIPVDKDGVVDLDALARLLSATGRTMVSVMLANNETGVIQPVAEVSRIAHEAGAVV